MAILKSEEGIRLMALGKHILFDELGLCLVEHSKISPRLGWSILNIGIFADEYL